MILNDIQIDAYATSDLKMIDPYLPEQIREVDGKKIISMGLSSFGYDVSLANKFMFYNSAFSVHQPSDHWNIITDPLNFDADNLLETTTIDDYAILPPHGYVLGHTNEIINMPDDVNALLVTKSTYARVGVFCNTTPIEAGWCGQITLELANLTDRPVKLYVNQGIGQLQFFKGMRPKVTYADRNGKYMHQRGVVTPKG